MRHLYISFVLLILFNPAFAQQDTTAVKDTTTHYGGLFALNFTQVSLSNWAAGGQNSAAGNAIVNYFSNYKKGKNAWDNNFDLAYGLLSQGRDNKAVKSDDKIDLSSKYGHAAGGHWYYSALLNFRSQFAPGYNYPNDSTVISRFLAPGYILFALGMDYKPSDYFSLFLSPATARFIIVTDTALSNQGAFGVDTGKTVTTQIGAYIKAAFKKDIATNVNLQTSLDLFSNYLKDPQDIVINWQVLISLKVNKYISASISTQLLYDDKITIIGYQSDNKTIAFRGPRTQFKEVIGVGFSYKFAGVKTQ
jgi:hypothetical protein